MPGPKPKMGRPPLRPNPYDPGILDRICQALVTGQSLLSICKPMDMPTDQMVYRAMASDENFAAKIAHARALQQDAIIDETVEMADKATPETVHVVKLQIWARQWRAGKLAPKKYGEKQQVEHSGSLTLQDLVVASQRD